MNTESLRELWEMFQREHRCSVDRLICNPELRNEFVSAARNVVGCDDEQKILWALVGLRKRKVLPAILK